MTKLLPDNQAAEGDQNDRLDGVFGRRGGCLKRLGGAGLLFVILILGSNYMWSKLKADYTIKAQVSSGFSRAFEVRKAIEEYVATHEALPVDNAQAGLPPGMEIRDRNVARIDVAHGKIVIEFGGSVAETLVGRSIELTPDIDNLPAISWTCSSPDLPEKWLPDRCHPQ